MATADALQPANTSRKLDRPCLNLLCTAPEAVVTKTHDVKVLCHGIALWQRLIANAAAHALVDVYALL
jgi:hypothetical protein